MNDMSRHQDLSPQAAVGSDLDAFWMPFTANRQFKSAPRMLERA